MRKEVELCHRNLVRKRHIRGQIEVVKVFDFLHQLHSVILDLVDLLDQFGSGLLDLHLLLRYALQARSVARTVLRVVPGTCWVILVLQRRNRLLVTLLILYQK